MFHTTTPRPLYPPHHPHRHQPPHDNAHCSQCGCTMFWSERTGPSSGWRCCTCVPSALPEAAIAVVQTKVAAFA